MTLIICKNITASIVDTHTKNWDPFSFLTGNFCNGSNKKIPTNMIYVYGFRSVYYNTGPTICTHKRSWDKDIHWSLCLGLTFVSSAADCQSYSGGCGLSLHIRPLCFSPDDSIINQCPLRPNWVGLGIMSSTQLCGHQTALAWKKIRLYDVNHTLAGQMSDTSRVTTRWSHRREPCCGTQ